MWSSAGVECCPPGSRRVCVRAGQLAGEGSSATEPRQRGDAE
eukprot:CAMPEP_0204299566 /NCGR_PEP_ID=MMETSP0468-20130131/76975_1 /ASSEMBLY_ACC=CAM_ASM_000383 /TAXON_ID=2969 /ORGANISM="Oxyrrhis marina" /LENGTH=41 /DNA_ID= /DNA_START= /DNA_END= /DNA_ORIENTATION=